MRLRKVLFLAALAWSLATASSSSSPEIRYEIFDTDESLDYQVAAESLKSISVFDAVNLDFESCDKSLINRLKAASKVVSVEQERSVECEGNLLALTKDCGRRERELNTTVAVLEHQLAARPRLEKERGEALLQLKRTKVLVEELRKQNDDLEAEARGLKRRQTHLKLQCEEKLEKVEQALRSEKARNTITFGVALCLAFLGGFMLGGIISFQRRSSDSLFASGTTKKVLPSRNNLASSTSRSITSCKKETLLSTADSSTTSTGIADLGAQQIESPVEGEESSVVKKKKKKKDAKRKNKNKRNKKKKK